MNLVNNPHFGLEPPSNSSISLIKGHLKYYHYTCDGFDDKGWGCGYRTLQTIFSWITENQETRETSDAYSYSSVPSVLDIQKSLVDMCDKDQSFIGSRQWIGSVEVAYCIEYFYKVQCRIIHTRDIKDLMHHINDISNHLKEFGSPIMMGGDQDCSSKCILGVSISPDNNKLLILDPHYSGFTTSRKELQAHGWVKWQPIDSLNHSSFYNLCCPLLKAKD